MSKMPGEIEGLAYVTASVLKWARERRGLSVSATAEAMSITVKDIEDWESGAASPPFQSAENLAVLFRIPFGFLFLSNPPDPAWRGSFVGCHDCDAPYGDDGWVDVVIPDEIWNDIAPDCSLLCFRCMTKRIEAKGLEKVPVIVASGPYADANERWRMIGWHHGYGEGVLADRPTS